MRLTYKNPQITGNRNTKQEAIKELYKLAWSLAPDIFEIDSISSVRCPSKPKDEQANSGEFVENKKYDNIDSASITEVYGKLAYVAKEWGEWFIVYDGKEQKKYELTFIPSPSGSSPSYPKEINKKLTYAAVNSTDYRHRFLIIHGDEEIETAYLIGDLAEINGKLAYVANDGQKQFIVYWDQEIGKQYLAAFDPTEVNNKLAYIATVSVQEGFNKQFIVYDGQEIGKEYDNVLWVGEVNGKLTYVAAKDYKYFFVYDGKPQTPYDAILAPIVGEINGKLVYGAESGQDRFIVYGDQKIGENYEEGPVIIGDKIAYTLSDKSGESKFIVYDGKEIGKEYDSAESPTEIGGRLAYLARKWDKSFIVHDGKEGKKYEYIDQHSLRSVNGKLAFVAEQGDKSFIVLEAV